MKLMASPWSPPAFMKTNNDMNGGGKLRRECYADWADIIINYLLEYRRHGINVQALSVQNEPVAVKTWDSCLYSVEEETAFAVQYLRPRLARQGMDEMEIYIWDHDKDGLVDWAELAFADEANYKELTGWHSTGIPATIFRKYSIWPSACRIKNSCFPKAVCQWRAMPVARFATGIPISMT